MGKIEVLGCVGLEELVENCIMLIGVFITYIYIFICIYVLYTLVDIKKKKTKDKRKNSWKLKILNQYKKFQFVNKTKFSRSLFRISLSLSRFMARS